MSAESLHFLQLHDLGEMQSPRTPGRFFSDLEADALKLGTVRSARTDDFSEIMQLSAPARWTGRFGTPLAPRFWGIVWERYPS